MSEKQKHQVIRSQIDETKEEKRRREIEKEKKRAHEKNQIMWIFTYNGTL